VHQSRPALVAFCAGRSQKVLAWGKSLSNLTDVAGGRNAPNGGSSREGLMVARRERRRGVAVSVESVVSCLSYFTLTVGEGGFGTS